MFDRIATARDAVAEARGRVLRACIAAADDGQCIELCGRLAALEFCLRTAEYLAGEAYREALEVKVRRSHSTAAPQGGAHGA